MTAKIIQSLASVLLVVACNSSKSASSESKDRDEAANVAAREVKPAEPAKPVESAQPVSTRPTLQRTEPLSPMVRNALRQLMRDHGDDMESLLWAALMLDYESTEAIADRMAASPQFAQPAEGNDDTLNALLPPEFFAMQESLAKDIGAVRSAAKAKNDAEMAAAYGRVAQTCIQCHSLYLGLPAGR